MSGQAMGITGGISGAIAVAAVLIGLAVFGLAYNCIVARVKRRRPNFPSSALVAIGVLVTMAGIGILNLITTWPALIITAAAFAASGAPMIIGDLWRMTGHDERIAQRSRRRAHHYARRARRLAAEAEHGNETSAGPKSLE